MNPAPILSAQFHLHLARAAYWTAFARTPANLARHVTHWDTPSQRMVPMNAAELIDDAMNTAADHLHNAEQVVDLMAATKETTP